MMRRSSYGGGRSNKGDRSGRSIKSKSRGGGLGIDLTPTNILIAMNVGMFLLCKKFPDLTYKFLKYDRMIARGQSYRLMTALFLHKTVYHIFSNCFSLYQIGPSAEAIFGKARFVTMYLAAGVMANAATYVLKSSPFSLGASGSLFGVIGATGMYLFRNKDVLGPQSEAYLSSLKRSVIMNLMFGAAIPNIDNTAHIGGFVAGALTAYLFGPRFFIEQRDGRRVRVDRPVINYAKYWRKFMASGNGIEGGGGGGGGEEGEMRRRPAREPMTDD